MTTDGGQARQDEPCNKDRLQTFEVFHGAYSRQPWHKAASTNTRIELSFNSCVLRELT